MAQHYTSHSKPFIPKKYKNVNLCAQSLVAWHLNPPHALFRLHAPPLPLLPWSVRLVIRQCLRLVHPYMVFLPLCPPCPHPLLRQRPALLLSTCAALLFLLAPDLSHLHAQRRLLSVMRHPSARLVSAPPLQYHPPNLELCPSPLPLLRKFIAPILMNQIEKWFMNVGCRTQISRTVLPTVKQSITRTQPAAPVRQDPMQLDATAYPHRLFVFLGFQSSSLRTSILISLLLLYSVSS